MRADAMRGERFNILLVEDNPAHAELVMRGFEDFDPPRRFFHVLDGSAALDYLFHRGAYADGQAESPRPHVILLDLRLPRVDGLDVLQQIKASEELRSIPVVVLTTSRSETDVENAYRNHANSYVVKPMDFTGFSKLSEELNSYWLERNYQAGA